MIKNLSKEQIEKKLLDSKILQPKKVVIIDNSENHKNHFKAYPLSHVKIKIYSDKIKQMDIKTRHKTVYDILDDEIKNHFHAIELDLK